MTSLNEFRKSYEKDFLTEENAYPNPYQQFEAWLQEAINGGVIEPNAMTLATVGADMQPNARIVLLKSYDFNGFVFFTNYESSKGHELAHNPKACLLFFWLLQERQVRIQGLIEKVSESESTDYFNCRPEDSRIGAWASPQSRPITQEVLQQRFEEHKQKFEQTIPKPEYWGGYRLKPTVFEFWQGRPSRLHDRLIYTEQSDQWLITRVAP